MTEETEEYTLALPQAHASNGTKPLTRLCALDTLFLATGTVDVKVGDHTVTLPIRAVDNEEVDALAGMRPTPATRSEIRQGRRHIIVDETEPGYMKRLEDYQRDYGYIYVLCALAVDIVNSHDAIVWSMDNSIHDLAAAKLVLKQMGLVDNQRATILNAALDLTRDTEQTQVQD